MFDWVPIYNYTSYFDISILIIISILLFQCHSGLILKKDIANLNGTIGFFFVILLIFYMGLRPVSEVFGDTVNYARSFNATANSHAPFEWEWEGEWLFYNLSNWFSKYSDLHTFFLFCSALYIIPLTIATIRIFKNYYFIPLIIFFCMFTFWSYGVNGIRNGIGASFFILSITFTNNIPLMLMFSIIGTGFHSTVYLMIAAAFFAWFIKNSYLYLSIWITSIGVSYLLGEKIQSYLATFGFLNGDERLSGYLTGDTMIGEVIQMSMVFRWDFLFYSSIGVFIGYYFIFHRNYKDEYYHWIYNIYLATNAFWILVIRAAYSNRFAQISWFILPLVLIYPFMKKRFWINHEMILAIAILIFYAFGFYTNIWQTGALFRFF